MEGLNCFYTIKFCFDGIAERLISCASVYGSAYFF